MTPKDSNLVDDAGGEVLRFISEARNLSRIGELADEVLSIATSNSWRRYRTATGVTQWRKAEFDYFLISCGLSHEDIGRAILHTGAWSTFAKIMDANADESHRRTLHDAASSWTSPSNEGLIQRAQRLGWTKDPNTTKLRAAPLPPRRPLYSSASARDPRQTYVLRRLAHERPDLYQRVLNEEMSPSAAMRAAGLVRETISINTDPERAAATIRRHLNKRSIARLVKLLQQ
jgi:hypothetical protein